MTVRRPKPDGPSLACQQIRGQDFVVGPARPGVWTEANIVRRRACGVQPARVEEDLRAKHDLVIAAPDRIFIAHRVETRSRVPAHPSELYDPHDVTGCLTTAAFCRDTRVTDTLFLRSSFRISGLSMALLAWRCVQPDRALLRASARCPCDLQVPRTRWSLSPSGCLLCP